MEINVCDSQDKGRLLIRDGGGASGDKGVFLSHLTVPGEWPRLAQQPSLTAI